MAHVPPPSATAVRRAYHVLSATLVFLAGGTAVAFYASRAIDHSASVYTTELAVLLAAVLATLVATGTWYVARAATDRPVEYVLAALVAPVSAWINAGVTMAFTLGI